MPSLCLRYLFLSVLMAPVFSQLGARTGDEFDAQSVTTAANPGTWDGFQGVVRSAFNTYWVSARRSAPSPSLQLIEFSAAGAYLSSVPLPAALSASATGLLDLAYDSLAGVIYGGCEHAISGRKLWAFRLSTRAFDAALNVTVPASVPGNAVRGLTFDRFGNNGQGSFFCVDGGSAIMEFDRAGNTLRTLTNPHPNATALALDSTDRRLWVFGAGGSTKVGEGVVGIAVDLFSGLASGEKMLGSPRYPGTPAGGNVTGAEFAVYAHDHTVFRLALLTNATSDWVYEVEGRFGFGATCGGIIGFTGDAAYGGNSAWTVTLTQSSAATAFLLLAASQQTTPIAGPLFAAGCYVQLGLVTPPLSLGGAAVAAGRAQLAVPVPMGIIGSIYLQWIEAPAAGVLRSSNGGGVFVR